MKGFIGVDVTYPRDDGLIEENRFQASATAGDGIVEIVGLEGKWFWSQFCFLRESMGIVSLRPGDGPKTAGVVVAEFFLARI